MSAVELSKGEYADLATGLLKQVRTLKKECDELKDENRQLKQKIDALERMLTI